jgi:hypothetical protein
MEALNKEMLNCRGCGKVIRRVGVAFKTKQEIFDDDMCNLLNNTVNILNLGFNSDYEAVNSVVNYLIRIAMHTGEWNLKIDAPHYQKDPISFIPVCTFEFRGQKFELSAFGNTFQLKRILSQ